MSLKTTPLNAEHRRLGARMVEFGGWDMPVQYAGIVQEHEAVRTDVGLFDVSHMGEFIVEGPGALGLLQGATPNDVSRLGTGRAHYSSLLTDLGTFVDDILVYRLDEEAFMVVVNAGNVEKDFAWLEAARTAAAAAGGARATLRDASASTALIAVQGPRAVEVVTRLHRRDDEATPGALKYYGFLAGGTVAGRPVLVVSRTGYTGEDGFEIYLAAEEAVPVWQALLAEGAIPAGLGARDTLRLEAGMCLYGNDIDEGTTPIEAGLAWTVRLDKGAFRGRDVLARQLETGTSRRLVGLEVTGRGIARHGHVVLAGGEPVGLVTSGTHSPTLGRAIAMAYLPPGFGPGSEVSVDVRGRAVEARVTNLPFHSRKRKA